ncbi:hypothetical protein GH733_009114 [Mirounga leonina]|nr:hypothetical protein GH733_009114 [Mirounga leonina]
MDQCVTVERELEKVLHKFSGYGQLCERGLEELIDYTGGLKHEILQSHGQDAELSGTLSLVLTQCCKRIKDTVQKLASDHKDIHSSVSRVGKAIDKNFDSDISSVGIDGCWQADSQRLLNEVMVEHFFRQGMLDVAEELCQVINQGVKSDTTFSISSFNREDIQVLMGSLVYLRQGIENSPYVHLLDANQWADICDIFTRDACALLGLSVESPLSVSFSAGCVALPALINIKAVIEQRQCTGVWNQKDELPIEVDLGKKCWYHSIFACPILRQQTTDNNPPMKLVCGHIISRDALNKMFNGSKLKCPYCPMEQSPGDAKQIFF